ncbi:MAG: DUF2807 domain-containing protein [Reichenbachiella sp.]
MKNALLIITLFAITFFTACEEDLCLQGSGTINEYPLNVNIFSGISLLGPINLKVQQGNAQVVTVEAEPEMYSELTYRVNNEILEIGYEGNVECFDTDFGVTVNVTVPDISYISVNGISEIESVGDLNVETLNLAISGKADVTLTGSTNAQNIDLSGELIAHNFELEVKGLSLDISGLANMEVSCINTLDIEVSGSANIDYKGSPQITQNVSGSLNLTDKN